MGGQQERKEEGFGNRVHGGFGQRGGDMQLPTSDWLTDGEKRKVPHDPHSVAPQSGRAGRD